MWDSMTTYRDAIRAAYVKTFYMLTTYDHFHGTEGNEVLGLCVLQIGTD